MKRIYLDNAATTPVDPKVVKIMQPFLGDEFGNPGAIYEEGRHARKVLDSARRDISLLINSSRDDITFTSGGTESNNLAIFGSTSFATKSHIITTKIEHKSVLEPLKILEKGGVDVTYLNVDKEGLVDLKELKEALRDDTVLVSVMYANNEIGTIQPIKEISKIINKFKKSKKSNQHYPYFHTDACQASNYLEMNVEKLGVDLMTINGSKMYGPKGIGFLYVKKGLNLKPLIYGGGQERSLRSGTENIPSIVGLAEAFKLAREKSEKESGRLIELRDYFIDKILDIVPDSYLNGKREERLPNNINISILGIEGESLVLYLDSLGVAAATGSACNSQNLEGSYVIKALGKNAEYSHGSLRFSMGKDTNKGDMDYVLKILPDIVSKLRSVSAIRK